jgi:hypothetical protein
VEHRDNGIRGDAMKQWYCMKGGNEYGPIPEDDFVMMFLSGQLEPKSSVWCDGMDDWRAARDVEELTAAIHKEAERAEALERTEAGQGQEASEATDSFWDRFFLFGNAGGCAIIAGSVALFPIVFWCGLCGWIWCKDAGAKRVAKKTFIIAALMGLFLLSILILMNGGPIDDDGRTVGKGGAGVGPGEASGAVVRVGRGGVCVAGAGRELCRDVWAAEGGSPGAAVRGSGREGHGDHFSRAVARR